MTGGLVSLQEESKSLFEGVYNEGMYVFSNHDQ
jgi:hypothetical protein